MVTQYALLVLLAIPFLVALHAQEDARIPVTGSAWHLARADVDADGHAEIVYATYQEEVRCIRPADGTELWNAPIGGFPFDLAAADVNGDGRPEVFAAVADGGIYAFGPDGRALWTFRRNNAAMLSVATARIGGKGYVVAGGIDRTVYVIDPDGAQVAAHALPFPIRNLAVGDRDGDGDDEIAALDCRGVGRCVWLKYAPGGKLTVAWKGNLTVPRMRGNGQDRLVAYSLEAADLDGDGRCELVAGTGLGGGCRVVVYDADGKVRWASPHPRGGRGLAAVEMFSMTLVAPVVRSGKPEVLAINGGNVRRFDAKGNLLGQANARVGFCDLAPDGDTLYLGSTPGGDHAIYRVDLSGDWEATVDGLDRAGLAREIGDNIDRLQAQVEAAPAAPVQGRYVFKTRRYNFRKPARPAFLDWFAETYPYANVSAVTFTSWDLCEHPRVDEFGQLVPGAKPVPGALKREEIVELARTVEREDIPSYWCVDHTCTPHVSLPTLALAMDAAPTKLLGFISHEDEYPKAFPDYIERYIGPLADACIERGGRQIQMQEKNVFWFAAPAFNQVYDSLFAAGRGGAIIAGTDDANSRTPELNILGRAGLRQAGLIGNIQAAAIADLFCFSRMWEWEYPKHGHPFLRLLVAHGVLGADRFFIRDNFYSGRGFSEWGEEFADPFIHLLGKGLVFTPEPEQMVGLNPIGFAVHEPSPEWIEASFGGHNTHSWRANPEMDEAVVPHSNVVWGNTPTPEHALQAVLLNKTRQFGTHIPATPYGPFVFVPARADLDAVPRVREWWHTDGEFIWREGGPKMKGDEAARALRESFERSAAELPFRPFGDDVFFHTLLVAPDRYRIYAIDPGWLDPAERRITVKVQLPGAVQVRDLLSGEELPVRDGGFPLVVPAGTLRILEAHVR